MTPAQLRAFSAVVRLGSVHAAAEDEVRELLAQIEARANVVERMLVPVTPVIGAHTGPGLVGTAFYAD